MKITIANLQNAIDYHESQMGYKPDYIRISESNWEQIAKQVEDLGMIKSTVGSTPSFSGVRIEVVEQKTLKGTAY